MNKDLAGFSKVVSHDRQEPVRNTALFADVILRETLGTPSAEIQHAAERTATAGHRTRRRIACPDQYVGIDTSTAAPAACDPAAPIESARAKVATESGAVPIHVHTSTLPVVTGGCDQLELLFYHLFANAVQAKRADA